MDAQGPRVCEQCGSPERPDGKRFCKSCEGAVLLELRASGTLAPIIPHGTKRSRDHMEDIRMTKFGREG